MQTNTGFDQLKRRYGGSISAQTESTEALVHAARAHELLSEWNPVGSSIAQLVSLMGKPSRASPGQVEYCFDGGFDGDLWIFRVDGQKIIGVEHQPME